MVINSKEENRNHMNKIITAITLLALCIVPGFGAFSSNDAGTSSGQFLKLDIGARAAGMGGAFAGVADDSTAMYWNPAGLDRIPDGNLSLMHAALFEDISYDWFSYAQAVLGVGTIGIGAQYMSYGSIKKLDSTGLETGSMNPTDSALMIAYANKFFGVHAGISVKYISSTIDSSASAYAFDAGVMKGFMQDRLMFGAVVQNVGTGLKYVNDEAPLPMNIKIGGAYNLSENWLVALDINSPVDNEAAFAGGSEYVQSLNKDLSVALRAGYNTRNKDTGGLNGVTVGAGIDYAGYTIDYAFVPYGNLGDTQRIALTIKFGYSSEDLRYKQTAAKPDNSQVYEQKQPAVKPDLPKVTGQKQATVKSVPQTAIIQKKPVIKNNPPVERAEIPGNIAVAEFEGKNVPQAEASMVAGLFRAELANSKKFVVVEKANMDEMLSESDLQKTGLTASGSAVRTGKILNVKHMIVGSLSKIQSLYFVTVNVVDVETGRITASYKQSTGAAKGLESICRKIAQKIAADN